MNNVAEKVSLAPERTVIVVVYQTGVAGCISDEL